MGAFLSLTLLLAAMSGSAADRDAIAKTVRLTVPCGSALDQPWSEVTPPRLSIDSILVLSPRTAVVEATCSQYGSTIVVRRAPLRIVLRKAAREWRVVSIEKAADPMAPLSLPR